MTYLRLISDVHFNEYDHVFSSHVIPNDDEWRTILLVAGDLGHRDSAIEWLQNMSERFANVVLVLGNHDYYNHDEYYNFSKEYGVENDTYNEKLAFWRSRLAAINNLHLLENQVIELDGVRIIGATLWSDFLDNSLIMRTAQVNMTDYDLIDSDEDLTRRITPIELQNKHRESVRFIENALKKATDLPTIVLTHHAPTWQCITKQDYLEDELTHAYNTNLDDLIKTSGAAFWAYGHTHTAHQVVIGNTLVVSNPYGFNGECAGYEKNQLLVIDDNGHCQIKEVNYS